MTSDRHHSGFVPLPLLVPPLPELIAVVWTISRSDNGRGLVCSLHRSPFGPSYTELRIGYSEDEIEITQLLTSRDQAWQWADGYRRGLLATKNSPVCLTRVVSRTRKEQALKGGRVNEYWSCK